MCMCMYVCVYVCVHVCVCGCLCVHVGVHSVLCVVITYPPGGRGRGGGGCGQYHMAMLTCVMQMEPHPIPTLRASTPPSMRFLACWEVTTFPPMIWISGPYFCLAYFTMLSWYTEFPWEESWGGGNYDTCCCTKSYWTVPEAPALGQGR